MLVRHWKTGACLAEIAGFVWVFLASMLAQKPERYKQQEPPTQGDRSFLGVERIPEPTGRFNREPAKLSDLGPGPTSNRHGACGGPALRASHHVCGADATPSRA